MVRERSNRSSAFNVNRLIAVIFVAACTPQHAERLSTADDWEGPRDQSLSQPDPAARASGRYLVPETKLVAVPVQPEPPPRCPDGMALLGEHTCVDRWESSLMMVDDAGAETAWSPYRPPREAQRTLISVSRADVVPQGYASGEDAMKACDAAGKRLCTAPEWEAACRGDAWTTYPYGDVRKKGACNDDGRKNHPVGEVHRQLGLPKERMWNEGMAHPLINQLPNTVEKTGAHSECTNELGTFDMVGNLHEWIADPDGTFRGGFYMDTQINGEGCAYATTAHPSTYADYSTGFRCCADAAPAD